MINSSKEILKIVKSGISLIPVHETGKQALVKWSGVEPLDYLTLVDALDTFRTSAVAMVLGEASGRMVCIDVDVKYLAGIDAMLVKDIESLYPEIWSRLRIEKTPSGGLHILYRVVDGVLPRHIKAANRYSTEDEIAKMVGEGKKPEKTKCFIEIKGEGQISQCYPSPKYTRIKDGVDFLGEEGICDLEFDEHSSLMGLCMVYNQVVKEDKKPKLKEGIEEIYSTNPYTDYDGSEAGSKILEEHGWTIVPGINSEYVYYAKPNKKEKGVSASYSLKRRTYKIFTSSTELDTKAYSPSILKCELDFNGDRKALYAWLVKEGYGKLKPHVEKSVIARAVKNGTPIPTNISTEGRELYEKEKGELDENYPFGIFWSVGENFGVEISQLALDEIIKKMGFRWYRGGVVKLEGYLIKKLTENRLFYELAEYVRAEENVYNAFSIHINKYEKLVLKRLSEGGKLDESLVLLSKKYESYKFYKNLYLSITKEGREEFKYEDLVGKYVFEDSILPREYKFLDIGLENSKYYQYLKESVGISRQLYNIIGYLTHDYIDDSMTAIIVASEMSGDSKFKGGSGKNLFFNLLSHITSTHVIPGEEAKLDQSLLQSWDGQRILVISDIVQNFNLAFFKNFSSGVSSVKKLFKDVTILDRNQMPKPVILTNFSYKMVAGLERRVIDLEFTDFFSRIRGGVGKHFGCMFPGWKSEGEWDEIEWNYFDNIVLESIRLFLDAGELVSVEMTKGGWDKRFTQNYNHLHEFIKLNIDEWVRIGKVRTDKMNEYYIKYCNDNNILISRRHNGFRLNQALDEYCDHNKIAFNKDGIWTDEMGICRGRIFGNVVVSESEEDVPF